MEFNKTPLLATGICLIYMFILGRHKEEVYEEHGEYMTGSISRCHAFDIDWNSAIVLLGDARTVIDKAIENESVVELLEECAYAISYNKLSDTVFAICLDYALWGGEANNESVLPLSKIAKEANFDAVERIQQYTPALQALTHSKKLGG